MGAARCVQCGGVVWRGVIEGSWGDRRTRVVPWHAFIRTTISAGSKFHRDIPEAFADELVSIYSSLGFTLIN